MAELTKLTYTTGAAMIFWPLKEIVVQTVTTTQSVIHLNKYEKTESREYLKKMGKCLFAKLILKRIEHHVMMGAQIK